MKLIDVIIFKAYKINDWCDRTYDVFLKFALYVPQELSSRRDSIWLLFFIIFIFWVIAESCGHHWIKVDLGFSGNFISLIFL